MAQACTGLIPSGFRVLPLPLAQLSLAAVLQCGQSFRWNIIPLDSEHATLGIPTHEYRLCLRDRVVCLRQSSEALYYRSVFPDLPSPESLGRLEAQTLEWIRDYFQLDVNLVDLYEQWAKRDPIFQRHCSERFGGIRMLRQDPWENLISFICSSNNNISRITKMVKGLCQHYSPALLTLPRPSSFVSIPEVDTYHPFPPPSVLAAPEVAATLRSLGFGYRADFIHKTAKMLVEAHGLGKPGERCNEPAEAWLYTLRNLSTQEAREELLKLMGVGRKVADCILLMSLDKKEVIPVDTHVHQIAMKHYGMNGSLKGKTAMNPKLYEVVSSKLTDIWGNYAGWAQTVLFTSDLKSFATYGLPSPAPSPLPSPSPIAKKTPRGKTTVNALTPPATPGVPVQSGRKRKAAMSETPLDSESDIDEGASTLPVVEEGLSMADRVKKRRRVRTRETSAPSAR